MYVDPDNGNDVLTIYAMPTAEPDPPGPGEIAGTAGNAIYHGLKRSGARPGPYSYNLKLFDSNNAGVGIATYSASAGSTAIEDLVDDINTGHSNYPYIFAIFHNESEAEFSDPNTYANAIAFTNGSGS